jgi:hypothetical protein
LRGIYAEYNTFRRKEGNFFSCHISPLRLKRSKGLLLCAGQGAVEHDTGVPGGKKHLVTGRDVAAQAVLGVQRYYLR